MAQRYFGFEYIVFWGEKEGAEGSQMPKPMPALQKASPSLGDTSPKDARNLQRIEAAPNPTVFIH